MITFTANKISKVNIPSLNLQGEHMRRMANFVELSPNVDEDLKTMENLTKHWACNDTLLLPILDNLRKHRKYNYDKLNRKYFLITEQKDLTPVLDEKQILGVAETSYTDLKRVEIDYFQTKPKMLDTEKKFEMHKIGRKFLKIIKDFYNTSDIWLFSTHDAEQFYKDNGFKKISETKVGLPVMMYYRRGKTYI